MTTAAGMRMTLDPTEAIDALYLFGSYEYNVAALLDRLLPHSCLFLDVGANVGYFSLRASLRKDVQVIAVEANPEEFPLLHGNVALNNIDNIECRHVAIGAEVGKTKLHTMGYQGVGSFIGQSSEAAQQLHKQFSEYGGTVFEVDVTTIDRLVASRISWRERPIALKMDIEGGEVAALQGARSTLGRVHFAIIEHNPLLMRGNASSGTNLNSEIESLGFSVFAVNSKGRLRLDPRLSQGDFNGNLFCIRTEKLPQYLPQIERFISPFQ